MKQALHTAPAYPDQAHAQRRSDDTRWSLVRLLLAAMLTVAVLAAATGLAS